MLVTMFACGVLGLADGPVRLIAEGEPGAVLEFRIQDEHGRAMPGRLTFVRDGQVDAPLFSITDGAPEDLAVRQNVVYTLSGQGAIVIPPGPYTIYATRGLEYSRAETALDLEPGGRARFEATLVHEVDTDGWISGDYHLHTLTYSGHGDSSMPERIISLVGEGVEFAVATDHNHNTDYGPTMERVGAMDRLRAVTGNEVSTQIGHFNAFPLDPSRPVVDHTVRDAERLFRLIRREPNAFGTTPVVQVNHPRWDGIDYFTRTGLSPLSGEAEGRGPAGTYSDAFDTVEVFNENVGWGYFDPETSGMETGVQTHSVLRDWFNLLNRGVRVAAVGNSDSHTVHYAFCGYPRNFTPSDAPSPDAIDPARLAAELRAMRVFTTTGPVVDFRVEGAPMGATVAARDGVVEAQIRVQAASWIGCDRIRIVVNGDVVRTIEVSQGRGIERFDDVVEVAVGDHDGWVCVLVEGDESLSPILHHEGREVLPMAICNPVFVDADGDGQWTAPAEWARELVDGKGGDLERVFARVRPTERGLVALAAARGDHPLGDRIVARALSSDSRETRLRALEAARVRSAGPATRAALAALLDRADATPLERVACVRALVNGLEASEASRMVAGLLRDGLSEQVRRDAPALMDILRPRIIEDWWVRGPIRNGRGVRGLDREVGSDEGGPWRSVRADERGYLDLIEALGEPCEEQMAEARAIVHSDEAREVLLALGTDDGCRAWVNGELVVRDNARHGATRYRHVVPIRLREGENEILVRVENGRGGFGLYASLLDAGG